MKNLVLFLLIIVLNTAFNTNYIHALNTSSLTPIELDYNFYDMNKFIDSDKLKYCYFKYSSYLDELNYILKDLKEFKDASLEDILKNLDSMPEDVAIKAKINASNAINYEYFFKNLSPEKTPIGDDLLREIYRSFSSFDNFKTEFKKLAISSNSSWIFLARDQGGHLYLATAREISSPIIYKHSIVLCLNIDRNLYSNKGKYIDDFFNFVNWRQVYKNYAYKIY